MIGAAAVVVGRLAEGTEQGSDQELPAWAIGLTAFLILVLLLFVVTRFNRDR